MTIPEGSVERVDEPTPNGGDYSIAIYSDDQGNPTTPAKATHVEIKEYKKSGACIMRTYMEKSK